MLTASPCCSMRKIKEILKTRLEGAERVALLGIGSEMRADDAAGILVARELELKQPSFGERVRVFVGHASPESLTGEIKRYRPTHLLIVDAADLGLEPGGSRIIQKSEIDGVSFSTHRLPTRILADYLEGELSCEIIIIGIQPLTMELLKPASETIRESARGMAAPDSGLSIAGQEPSSPGIKSDPVVAVGVLLEKNLILLPHLSQDLDHALRGHRKFLFHFLNDIVHLQQVPAPVLVFFSQPEEIGLEGDLEALLLDDVLEHGNGLGGDAQPVRQELDDVGQRTGCSAGSSPRRRSCPCGSARSPRGQGRSPISAWN